MTDTPPAPPLERKHEGERWSGASKWLGLAANLGVLLGLIVLIVEVRQNAALTRLSLEVNRANLLSEIELTLAAPAPAAAWMKAIHTPEQLSDAELRMAETQLVAIMQQWDTVINLWREGLVDRARVEMHIANTAPFYFGSRFAQRWWGKEESGWNGTLMWEIADPIIDALDPDFLVQNYAYIREPFTAPGVDEAQAFMAAYGDELQRGDRAAIAARYASAGAMVILDGAGGVLTRAAIEERYETGWTPPLSFEWVDLAYEPLGPNMIAVAGRFRWTMEGGEATYSYTGLLQREDGALRIVLEDENRIEGDAP